MFDIENTIRKRRSVRTFLKQKIDADIKKEIVQYACNLHNPLGPKVEFRLIDKASDLNGDKLGTYGIIKGAELYVGAKIKREEYALEALGYDFEQLVLYLTDKDLGTCWLGGTFNKGTFAEAMEVGEDEIFTIISPIGYTAAKMSIIEKLMRKGSKGDMRLLWEDLFYKNEFGKAISVEDAGEYAEVLELVRLAPSAVNRQPWRIVMEDNNASSDECSGKVFHFYQSGIKPDDKESSDMHRIDMGIAICHFHLAALEKGLTGKFVRKECEIPGVPSNAGYIISWVSE